MTIIEAMRDPKLFGPFFRNLSTWSAWIVALKALFGLPMEEAEAEVYRKHTGRQDPPARPVREGWFVKGRRAGGSRIAALIVVYLATLRDYSGVLVPGERGTVAVLASDRKQARTVFRYVTAFIEAVPMLAALVERKTAEEIDLKNGITIEVRTSSFRTVRGYSIVAAVLEEVAYWRDEETANPDVEIVAAIRPAMATIPGALLLGISSPYARRGLLWEMHRKHFGREDAEVLVWQAETRAMNPTVDPAVIARAYEEDEAAAAAEYGAVFRSDVETFVSREVVESVVVPGRFELPPVAGVRYSAFVDPSGGAQDSYTLAIAFRDGEKSVLAVLRERKPPFNPAEVTREFCEILKQYRCSSVSGDRYSAGWVQQEFAKNGIRYEPSSRSKSEIYAAFLGPLNSGRIELLDNVRLVQQLVGLERRVSRSGKDSIDHGPGGHDDLINAAAGALVECAQPVILPGCFLVGGADDAPERGWRRLGRISY